MHLQVNEKFFFELNGEARAVGVVDTSAAVEHVQREKANPGNPGEVGAPMSGVVIEVRAQEGAEVKAGDPICVLSAMKMETIVSSAVSGRVEYVAVKESDSLSAGDLIVKIVKV